MVYKYDTSHIIIKNNLLMWIKKILIKDIN